MIQDIFIPSRLGSYYLFSKRVLAFEITSSLVQATLVHFSFRKIVVENSMSITIYDHNQNSVINAIKKIATSIGSYDEVVTSLTSSAVIFKELVLPFIGHEKIAMIIHYEVEPLLPFSLDDAIVDFLIIQENKETLQSTVLVAATRKSDMYGQTAPFEKAGVTLAYVTLDVFALYDFYRHAMYVAQAQTSLLLVDFSFDAIRVAYIQKGILTSVRLIPCGLTSMMQKADQSIGFVSSTLVEDMIKHHNGHEHAQHRIFDKVMVDFCKHMTLSLAFFEKQVKNYTPPAKAICLGIGTSLPSFFHKSFELCNFDFEPFDLARITHKNNISLPKKLKLDYSNASSLVLALSAVHYGKVNFLSFMQKKQNSRLFNYQVVVALFLSIFTCASVYFYSQYELKKWHIAYNKSKKELTYVLQEQLDLDVKHVKRVVDIVQAAQDKLEQTKKVCFSLSQSNNSFLQYLQELSTTIDRESIGLVVQKMIMQDKEVILQGRVKDFDALQVFEEELMSLTSLTLQNIPGELTFSVTLHIKKAQEKDEGHKA